MADVGQHVEPCPSLIDTLYGLQHALSPLRTPDQETRRLLAASKADVRDLCIESLKSQDQKEAMLAGMVLSRVPMLYPHPKDEWGTLVAELTATLRELLARLYSCCRVPPVVLLEGEGERVWVGVVECGSKEPARTERIVGRIKACGHSLACCLKTPNLVGGFRFSPQPHFLLLGAAWKVNWHTLSGVKTTEVCLLQQHLSEVCLTFWSLLEATVCLMNSHIVKYRDMLEGYVVDALTWTAGVPVEKAAIFVPVRTAVYSCLSALSEQTHDTNTCHCPTFVTNMILDATRQQKTSADRELSSAAVTCLHSLLVYTHVERETAAKIGCHIADLIVATAEPPALSALGACIVALLRSGCGVPDIGTVLAELRDKCPKAYMETSHALGASINPARPVLAAPMLGGELPSGRLPLATGSDHVPGPIPLSNGGIENQDSAQLQPKELIAVPPPPQTNTFSHFMAADAATPLNDRSRERALGSPVVLDTPALPTGPPAFMSTAMKPSTSSTEMELDTITIATDDEMVDSPLPFQPNLVQSDEESN